MRSASLNAGSTTLRRTDPGAGGRQVDEGLAQPAHEIAVGVVEHPLVERLGHQLRCPDGRPVGQRQQACLIENDRRTRASVTSDARVLP